MKDLYKNHPLCTRHDCTMQDSCLRALGIREAEPTDKFIQIINPQLTTGQSDCQWYAPARKVRNAYNFKHFMDNHCSKVQADHVRAVLGLYFGKNPYYERFNGSRPISPEEQQYIRSVFAEVGITADPFTGYKDCDEWPMY